MRNSYGEGTRGRRSLRGPPVPSARLCVYDQTSGQRAPRDHVIM